MRQLALTLALGTLLSLAAPSARADDASEALLHYELGAQLYAQRHYAEALDHFLAAHRLAPNANYALNIAQTYGLLHRPREAYGWYDSVLRDFEPSVEARAEAERLRDALAPSLAVLEITSDPPGAEIYVDRAELGSLGRTPRRIAVEPGSRAILLSLAGRHDARVTVEARIGERLDVRASLSPIVGTLSVTGTEGASVALEDGAALGTCPLSVQLPIGDVRLTIARDGYVAEHRAVHVEADAEVTLDVRLVRAASSVAQVSVVVDPPGALVLLDDDPIGIAPLTRDDASPGTHAIEIRATGRDTWSGVVVLEAGAATHVRAQLRDPSAIPWEGWAYLGYGGGAAIAAAAIGCGIGALVAREAAMGALYVNPTRAMIDEVDSLAVAADVLGAIAAAVLVATFVWDLATGPPPPSSGAYELDR